MDSSAVRLQSLPACVSTQAAVGSPTERRVWDLPWGPWQVWLVVEIQTVASRRCGRHRERISFLAGKANGTQRPPEPPCRKCFPNHDPEQWSQGVG